MPTESERRRAWERLQVHVAAMVQQLTPNAATRQELDQIMAVVEATMLASSPVDAPAFEPRSNIQEFFQAIGEGVRAAQENLDEQSAAYIHNRPAFAPDTVFRVPKVSANLRLGLSEVGTKGINFIIINKSEQTQEVEQEISFEVVAAPPPPDAIERIADLPLGQIIASNPIDRSAARDRLADEAKRQQDIVEQATDSQSKLEVAKVFVASAKKMLDDDGFRRVLVHRSGGRYVLVFVPEEREDARPEFGMAILGLPEIAGADAEVAAKDYTKADKGGRPLLEILIALADRQAKLLTELKRG